MSKKRMCIGASIVVVLSIAILIFIFIKNNKDDVTVDVYSIDLDISEPSYDLVNNFAYTLSDEYIMESEDNYFFFDIFTNKLSKLKKDTGIYSLLCSNPQCKHNSKECTAIVNNSDGDFVYYNGRIYYLVEESNIKTSISEIWIVSMDENGEDKVKEYKLFEMTFSDSKPVTRKLYMLT